MEEQDVETRLSRQVRRDAFLGDTTVLRVEVPRPAQLDGLFRRAVLVFPDLTWYDGDISLALRYAAAFGVFPLARVRVEVQDLPCGTSRVSA